MEVFPKEVSELLEACFSLKTFYEIIKISNISTGFPDNKNNLKNKGERIENKIT